MYNYINNFSVRFHVASCNNKNFNYFVDKSYSEFVRIALPCNSFLS